MNVTAIVEETRQRFTAKHGERAANLVGGSCLYWAATVIEVAAEHDVRLCLQAGTAMFRRVPPKLDDGVMATHFSYVWNEETKPAITMRNGRPALPEMHVWAADPRRQHVVDLSTAFLAEQCRLVLGEAWLDEPPPAYFWGGYDDLPDGWVYMPNMRATIFAANVLALNGGTR